MSDRLPNPYSDEPLSKSHSDYVRDMKAARRGSRRAMRSGNPAKRAEAARINDAAPRIIEAVYRQQSGADKVQEIPHLVSMDQALE